MSHSHETEEGEDGAKFLKEINNNNFDNPQVQSKRKSDRF